MAGKNSFKKNAILFKEGDRGDCMYFINSGEVVIFKNTPAGPIHLARLSKAAVFGEMAIINKEPRSANALALTDITATEVSNIEFNLQIEKIPHWYKSIISMTSIRIRETNMRLLSGKNKVNITNISHVLFQVFCYDQQSRLKNTDFVVNEISEILGLNQSIIISGLKTLEKLDLVRFDRQEIMIPELEILLGYSEYLKIDTLEKKHNKEFCYLLDVLPRVCIDLQLEGVFSFYVELFAMKKELRQATRAELSFIEIFLQILQKVHIISFIEAEDSIKLLETLGNKSAVAKQFYRIDIKRLQCLNKTIKQLNLLQN
ncbi:MAG: Crp/Fnr family transcriptional regulator [Fibrobacterales bacterium]